jgi:hypothetical protein
MKALDSGILVRFLEGDPVIRELVRKLRGIELATTEVSMLAVSVAALEGPKSGQAHRSAAVDRLRRSLTVLPIDSRAVAVAVSRVAPERQAPELGRLAELGSLDAYGCDELFTSQKSLPSGKWRFRTTYITSSRHKKAK